MRVSTLLIGVFLLGFVLNLLYTGIMELRRLVRGISASAATRAGKRLSSLLQDARELLAHGLPGQARQVLEGVLRERGDHEAASLLLGEALLKLGDYDQAVRHLETCCLAQPEHIEFRYLLAEALAAARNPDGAPWPSSRAWPGTTPSTPCGPCASCGACTWTPAAGRTPWTCTSASPPGSPQAMNQAERAQGTAFLYQVGMAKVEADQFKEAAQVFQQVIKEDPAFVPAYLSLGRCMILQDQEPQGIEIWLEGFRTTGEGALLQEIEDYFIQSGKPEEGLSVLRRVAATSEYATTAKFFLGKMLYRLEILDEALVLFQEVRAQVVYSPILYFFMAKIHARRGRMDQALNEYRQLLRNLGVLKMRFECSVCGHRAAGLRRPLRRLRQLEQQPFPLQGERNAGIAACGPETGPWVGY